MSSFPAIIPAGGEGTRMRPISRYVSKPMFPVRNRPIIDYICRELRHAGADDIVVVGNPSSGPLKSWAETQEQVNWTVQSEPRGLADALQIGYRELNSPGQVLFALPDNLLLEGRGIGSIVGAPGSAPGTILGSVTVTRKQARYFGNSGLFRSESTDKGPENLEIATWRQDKGRGDFTGATESFPARRTVGRGLLTEPFFEAVEATEPDPESGEIDDGPVFDRLIERNLLFVRPMEGTIHDVGQPDHYLRAQSRVHRNGGPAFRPG